MKKNFKEYGLKTRREPFSVRGWQFESFSLFDLTLGKEVPFATCEYFSGSVDYEGKLTFVNPDEVDFLDFDTIESYAKDYITIADQLLKLS